MLNALGSALSWGYTEVFDPSAKLIRRTPSGLPVSDIVVTATVDGRLRVLVLTTGSVECWMVRDERGAGVWAGTGRGLGGDWTR